MDRGGAGGGAAPAGEGLRALFVLSSDYHGHGKVTFAWNADGTYLCTAGTNGLVHIFDRHGAEVVELQLESRAQCLAIDWDKDGEAVAILQTGVDRVAIWELATRSVMYIDTGLKAPSFLKWSKTGPQLAIGAAKGGLVIYRKDNRKKLPIAGKHSGAITCGDWSRDNTLALGGADSLLTLSTADGDTIEQTELKYAPIAIQFATQKTDARMPRGADPGAQPDTTVSVNMGGKTILLYNRADTEHPVELAFQAKYGRIVRYVWFGDGYLLIGFSEGWVVVISTHLREIGEELFSGRFHKDALDDISCSVAAQRAATAGGGTIKLIDMQGWKEQKSEWAAVDPAHGAIETLAWTSDGQLLTAATRSGHLYTFLARVATIVDAYGPRVAFMSSLREVSVLDTAGDADTLCIPVSVEPAVLAIGAAAVAVGMNNRVWYYRLAAAGRASPAGGLIADRDYVGTVDEVRLGTAHAAVLCGGRVYVHAVEGGGASSSGGGGRPDMKTLPERDAEGGGKATCIAIAGDFLFYGTSAGKVHMFNLSDWASLQSCEYRHEGGRAIRAIYPNALGTRAVVVDDAYAGVLFSPVDTRALPVPSMPDSVNKVLWDQADRNVFLACNAKDAACYLYTPVSMTGPSVTQLGSLEVQANGDMIVEPVSTALPSGFYPVSLADGVVTGYTQSGGVTTATLATHDALHRTGRVSQERLRASFAQNVSLLRMKAAWEAAAQLNSRPCWLALSGKAMEVLDVDVAQRVYRHLGDAGMVSALERVAQVEDRAAVAGYMALLFGDFPLAQNLLLTSPSHAVAALEMRKDLLEWETALKLAETLAPTQVPSIALELGKQLEFKGEYSQALGMYQSAAARLQAQFGRGVGDLASTPPPPPPAAGAPPEEEPLRVRRAVYSGIARMTLRGGDLRRGIAMASESGDTQLCRECGAILEAMKQFNDAATMYRKAEMWDKAVSILLATKNFSAAAPLMEHITTPKLHGQYAKAKEAAKDYAEAAKAYEKARDMDSVVRLLIDHLNAPERAGAIVRQTRSSEGAQLIARYCKSVGDFRGAIEFLLLAKARDESFKLAAENGEMKLYVQGLRIALAASTAGTDPAALMNAAAAGGAAAAAALAEVQLPVEECTRIAQFYEGKANFAEAGQFYAECRDFHRALKLFLQCGDAALERAIDVVGKAKQDSVTHALIDHLMGETDGVPKDPHYIFKLYVALGNFPQAAKTAIVIARQEQELGNYKAAHSVLFDTFRDLEAHSIRVPLDLISMLTLLHSYLLVKKLVKVDNHEAAARMMVRVAKNVSKFPVHIVPILTSTVIECQRAGMKRSAYDYASVLMRPEYRDLVEEKFRRKIEALIRRPNKEEEVEEDLTPCPFDGTPLRATELSCETCKNTIPFCIVTGRHMTTADCSQCPNCHFPALHTPFLAHLAAEPTCPLCGVTVLPASISLLRDPVSFLRKAMGVVGDDEDPAAAAAPPATGGAASSGGSGGGSASGVPRS